MEMGVENGEDFRSRWLATLAELDDPPDGSQTEPGGPGVPDEAQPLHVFVGVAPVARSVAGDRGQQAPGLVQPNGLGGEAGLAGGGTHRETGWHGAIVGLTLPQGQGLSVRGMSLKILVSGATGRFGRVCALLLERGHQVRALTRDGGSTAALDLAAQGAEVVTGGLDDPGSLRAALTGVDGAFASGTMHRAGLDGELRHGRTIADAAQDTDVPHLVYVSGAGAVPGTGVPLLEVKATVEQHLASLDVPVTILAPAYLMENLFNPWNLEALRAGKVRTFVPATHRLQQAPIIDVLGLAIHALEHPNQFVGQRIEVASDQPTAQEMAEVLTAVTGRPFAVDQATPDDASPGLAPLFHRLAQDTTPTIDIDQLRRDHPHVGWHTFVQWAEQHSWQKWRRTRGRARTRPRTAGDDKAPGPSTSRADPGVPSR
jgi:uncharacterized protein YbjT (DUF2867 family)